MKGVCWYVDINFNVVAHWQRTRLPGQRFRVQIRHDLDALQDHCDKVVNLSAEREIYPWGKKSYKKKLILTKINFKVHVNS